MYDVKKVLRIHFCFEGRGYGGALVPAFRSGQQALRRVGIFKVFPANPVVESRAWAIHPIAAIRYG